MICESSKGREPYDHFERRWHFGHQAARSYGRRVSPATESARGIPSCSSRTGTGADQSESAIHLIEEECPQDRANPGTRWSLGSTQRKHTCKRSMGRYFPI